jgi:flagellar hook-associated protein 1 FlgK
VANNPASRSARQAFLDSADALAKQLRGLDTQLDKLESQLDAQTLTEAEEINDQLKQLAELNLAIQKVERGGNQSANDLRDQRVELLEKLSEKLSIDVSTQDNGRLLLQHKATVLVSGEDLVNTIAFEANEDNQITLSWSNDANGFTPTEGRLGGLIQLKSGMLSETKLETDDLANGLMTILNEAHEAGYAMDGSTGRALFTGEDAASIEVNEAIFKNPSLLQVASRPNEPGNNENVNAMIQALNTPSVSLGGRTFSEAQIDLTTQLGQSIRQTERALQDQQAVESLMVQQRESISGVSIDEEMTELVKYQRAFQASAKLIGIIDDMLGSVISLSR